MSISSNGASYGFPDIYTNWQNLVTERDSVIKSINVFDDNIQTVLDGIQKEVATARAAKAAETAATNRKQLGWAASIWLGTLLSVQAALDGADINSLTPGDWLTHAGTIAYGYGFSGYYILDGQLDDADPGCGVPELNKVIARYPGIIKLKSIYSHLIEEDGTRDPYTLITTQDYPILKSYRLQAMIEDLKSSLSCLSGALDDTIDNLQDLFQTRIDLTENLIDSLSQENRIAKHFGYKK